MGKKWSYEKNGVNKLNPCPIPHVDPTSEWKQELKARAVSIHLSKENLDIIFVIFDWATLSR